MNENLYMALKYFHTKRCLFTMPKRSLNFSLVDVLAMEIETAQDFTVVGVRVMGTKTEFQSSGCVSYRN